MGIQRIIVSMSEDMPPVFFISGCQSEEQEELYAAMARSCNVHVPGPGRRLYAISHRHDGDAWFATVGKTLTGRRPVWKGRKKTEETRLWLPAIYPPGRPADLHAALEEGTLANTDALCSHISDQGTFTADIHPVAGIDVAAYPALDHHFTS
jgi:hypothetical protein